MKKQLSIVFILISFLIFNSCTDDEVNQDCFTCEVTETEYCINEGDDFYTVTVNGETTEVLLGNQLWAEIRLQLEDQCINPPNEQCFICNDNNIQTEYCYIEGNDFYTLQIENQDIIQISLDNNTWVDDIVPALEFNCIDTAADCYTCEIENIIYCYIEGDDFYTVRNEAEITQIPLEDQTWAEIKEVLEANCPTEFASIVGNWKLLDYQSTTQTTTIIDGNNVVSSSVGVGTDYNSFTEFTESPNEFNRTGITLLQETITDQNGDVTVIDDFVLESLTGTWEILENQLITLTDGDTETEISIILELTDTTLRLRLNETINNQDADGNPRTIVFEAFMVLERQ